MILHNKTIGVKNGQYISLLCNVIFKVDVISFNVIQVGQKNVYIFNYKIFHPYQGVVLFFF